jgi:hypothetical protein
MKPISIRLSARGIANIQNMVGDFEFIVGQNCYRCPSFVADFLSPKLASLHAADPTIHEYKVNTQDRKGCFRSFLSLGRGEDVDITGTNRDFFREICGELKNDEIIATMTENHHCEPTKDNIISLLSFLGGIDVDCSREIEFAASHFHELDESSIHELEAGMLFKIFQSKSLKIKSDDWLCGLICDLVSGDDQHFILFEFVQFEFLTTGAASRFIELAGKFADLLNSSILISLGRRFVLPVSPDASTARSVTGRAIGLKRDSPLDGIIAYLTSKCGGNVHERGIVTVTGSSNSSRAPTVADLQNRASNFQSAVSESNPWVCYNFKNLQVTPTHYALLSYHGAAASYFHPKSWYFEGSNDGTIWTVLHACSDNSDLNGAGLIGQYAVSKSMKCRFIRIRQIQHHNSGSNRGYLTLAGFELHGILYET